jgi:two-component sensor histidine kinase
MIGYEGLSIVYEEAIEMSYVSATDPAPFDSVRIGDVPERRRGQRELATAEELDVRQLRHHTKNTLQRILGLIAETPGLGDDVARELEYRIGLSATISNALFGLTEAPGSMAERLRRLSGALVDMMRGTDQVIRIGVSVRGNCPADLREVVLRCANELICNAIKHGMRDRPAGRITVRLASDAARTVLTIVDNGWGFNGAARQGEGLTLVGDFAGRHGGTLTIEGDDGTMARLELPHQDP